MTHPLTCSESPAAIAGPSCPDFLRDELLHEIFLNAAALHPDRTALRCRGVVTTYRSLATQAHQVARRLRASGLGRGDRVVVWSPRGGEMFPAMLGILSAGCTYVPADPDSPTDRVAFIARDCGAACVLTTGGLAAAAGAFGCRVIALDKEKGAIAAEPALGIGRSETSGTPDDVAYIIYTSGSTGRPKGVMVSHRAICHFVRSEGAVLALRSDDVVFQGASLSFDMSLEEIWPAWAVGASLLVGTKEMIRSGSDLASLLARERVTVWTCVPTLLAMQESRIPSLRLLNLGGEACPPELVRAWARPGLRILNTYGPTEAAITATFAELERDQPVTIGKPLPNYTAYVLPVPGEGSTGDGSGELCIGGPGLALGYVGRADLTKERFIANPCLADPGAPDPVLYRTGDRARINERGDLEFLGRIDTQVKVRGHRVELGEIEAALLASDELRQAVVSLRRHAGDDLLVAYLVPKNGAPLEEARLRSRLAERLPTYMVPAVFEPVASLPVLPSGKVDRNNLPAPTRGITRTRPFAPPITVVERRLHAACAAVFAPSEVSIDDDFFLDLGGHSLRAAAYVSALRKDPGLRHVSMADVYNHPTVRGLAVHLERTRPAAAAATGRSKHAPVSRLRYATCAVAQAFGLVVVYGLFSLQWLIPYLTYAWLYDTQGFRRLPAIAISLSLFLVAIPVMLMLGVAAKWLLLPRLRPGEYPLWGLTYYRWWLVRRLLETVPIHYLGRTPLLSFYYRLLGARIGRGVLLDSVPIDAPDNVTIGDETGFGTGASLACCRVERGVLKVGIIEIGRRCHVGVSSVVAMNTRMGDEAVLGDLSLLPAGQSIPAGETWSGSPARFSGMSGDRTPAPRGSLHPAGLGVTCAALLLVFPLFAILPIFPGMMLMTEIDQNTDAYGFVLLSPLLAIAFVATMCLQIALLKWLLVGRVKPGGVPIHSGAYVRHWLVDQLMQLSLDVVNPLYATLYLNPWYRLLGVKLQPRAEVSTASSISYDLLEIGEESFIADAVSLGAPRIDRGVLALGRTSIGRRAFVGNSAVIPSGTTLGDGVLVGVLSVPPRSPDDACRKDSSWFGTPAVFLPQRQAATAFGEGSTFKPPRALVAQRLAIEFARVILPMTVLIALTSLLMSFVVDLNDAGWPIAAVVLVFPLLYIAYGLIVGAVVAAVKWLVVGRYRPVEKPLWSRFVWRSELVTSTYENLAVPLFVDPLRGTPFLPMYLRLLGSRIGRRVYMDTTDVTEFDMVAIGDDAALNRDSGPQTHLFEDRVMKISRVDIGARCVVGDGSIVLYDSRMEDDSTLGDLSMLMKGETLPAGTRWEGSPARPAEGA